MKGIFLVFGIASVILGVCHASKPRVLVFTDINIDAGDPDDRQSLVHLLWYADELQIEGIIPDRWNARSVEACNLVIDAYAEDYTSNSLRYRDYPKAADLRALVAQDKEESFALFDAAVSDKSSPLYVLVWGNMRLFTEIVLAHPEYANSIRLITIGTGLMLEKDIEHMPPSWEKSKPCKQLNWNGFGRKAIYENSLFDDMWWLEMNWTYAGMFVGEEPRDMFHRLSKYGSLGKHIGEVVKNAAWAQYFRVGDTPSVIYLLDPLHDPDDPTQSSWAGEFKKPFPVVRPNYYTDDHGQVVWDYLEPCNTWENHKEARDAAVGTLVSRRPEMYNALIEKLGVLYGKE